jgi:hypothetical protein
VCFISATGFEISGRCFAPAAKLGIYLVVTGFATEVFDDEIFGRIVAPPSLLAWKLEALGKSK